MTELQKKLSRIYSHTQERDVFGRRKALPSEIERWLEIEAKRFQDLEEMYPPSREDVISKKSGELQQRIKDFRKKK